MHFRLRSLIAALVLSCSPALAEPVALPAPTTPVQSAQLPIVYSDAQKIQLFADGLFGGLIEARQIPGAVFVVVKDQSVIFARGYGYANVAAKTPIDPERTLFRVASVSKLVTATAAMQMVESGKLRLDANVNDYLDFKLPDTFAQPVTLHNLMTHTGGFDDLFLGTSDWPAGPEIPLGTFLANKMPPRVMPPGQVINYSNMGWTLTGYLVERASGKPFAAYVHERIFEPLGMTHSRFGVPNPAPAEMATPYRSGGPTGLVDVGFDRDHMVPAAELVTSGTDMGRFMLAHLNQGIHEGRVILHPDTSAQMQAQHFVNGAGLDGWAYGFWERNRNGWRAIGHDGSWRGFGSMLMIVPEAKMGFFVSVNKDYDPILFRALVQNLFDQLFPPREGWAVPAPSAETPSPTAEQIAGTYISVRRVRSDYMKVGQLLSEIHVSAVEPGRLRASGERPRDFVYTGGGFWREDYNGQRTFSVIAKDGDAVTSIAVDQAAFERAAWFETLGFTSVLIFLVIAVSLVALIAWGVYGPLRIWLGKAVSHTPLPLRLLVVGASLLIVVYFAIVSITLSTAYPMDLIVQTPMAVVIGLWIPFVLLFLMLPLAWYSVEGSVNGRTGQPWRAMTLLPVLALAATLWFAWFWNIHAFAL